MSNLTRRQSLGLLAAATIPPIALAGAAPAITSAAAPPTLEELEHYYAFLWKEMMMLGQELGCGMCDSWTAHKSGGIRAYDDRFGGTSPSTRAKTFGGGA